MEIWSNVFTIALFTATIRSATPILFPALARPSMDAYGVDIGKTVEPLGFDVQFDKDGNMLPAWYSLVLID